MQPNNLTALDFEDIKASIKSYLRTRNEFTDYDFDGSSLSYLIDTLAYNSYYTAFNANMAINEAFLPSATVRDNVVNVAKLLNYVPRSITSSRGCLKLDVQTTQTAGAYPSSVTLRKGAVASGGNYIFNILQDITSTVNTTTGIATFDNVMIMEGSVVTFQYVVNTFATQVYKVPSEDADISTLSVRVKPNESSTTSDLYSLTDTITDLTETTRAYFLSEGEDMRYEVKFGDDTAGRALKDGEVVLLEYLVTSGVEANEITTFSFMGSIVDNVGNTYGTASTVLTVKDKSQLGAGAESLESIKYNAPRFYSAQYRAVTAQDYALIAKKVYSNADSVVAYGGDALNPPIYGKVFIAIQTKTGSLLNDATKKSIAADMRKYAMASIDPVVIDPEQMYLYLKVFAQYDPGTASNTSDIKTNIQNGINDWASQTQINNFNSTFRAQAFEKAVTLSDNSLSDVSLQLSILKYINPNTNQTNTYCIATGSDLYDSAPSNTGSSSDGSSTTNGSGDGTGTAGVTTSTSCKKEPVLLSGPFRTADRPGIYQQFEDDGFGNLRTFYNTGNKKVYTNNAAGTVNYNTGQICFGPVNIIGAGIDVPPSGSINVTDTTTGAGSITNADLLPTGIQIPVLFIPANVASIPAATPGTIINIINPEVTVVPVGTTPPPTIPLNSLTPSVFNTVPTTITVADITNAGDLTTSSCF